jgi:two-component system sensor kinase FixL
MTAAFTRFGRPAVVAIWLLALLAMAGVTLQTSLRTLTAEVETTGETLHRLISQRAAQNAAHMTSLIALASASEPSPLIAFRQVATSIAQFYPHISAVVLADIATGMPLAKVPDTADAAAVAPFVASVAQQRQGELRSYVEPSGPDRYWLAKRTPRGDMGLLVEIDPRLLLEVADRPAWASLTLSLSGQPILQHVADATSAPDWLPLLSFSKTVEADGQPLILRVERRPALAELLPPLPLLVFAAATLAALLALHFVLAQIASTRAAQALAGEAEERALLREREVRLAHASRVNSLGELASGIVHELTQPLTALLSQSQAALRLADKAENTSQMTRALEANVREARRAGTILERMRAYASNKPPALTPVDANAVVRDIAELLRADLDKRGIRLNLELRADPVVIQADHIALQQVLHNLIKNAAEAIAGSEHAGPIITLKTEMDTTTGTVTVNDNGPGLDEATMAKLFEPFFSTKPDGMGLGLSICRTLMEHMDGTVTMHNRPEGGASFAVTLPSAVTP